MNIKITIFIFCVFLSFQGFSQNFSPYFLTDNHNKYIDYLINSGKLKINHPLSQPYTVKELSDSIITLKVSDNNHWINLLNNELNKYSFVDSVDKNGSLTSGITGDISLFQKQNNQDKNINGSAFISYIYQNFGFFYKYKMDESYKDDSLYFGTTGKLETSIIGRTSDSYVQWNFKNLNLFLGRINRNFGIINEPSSIWSMNSYSFDHFSLEFSNRILKFSSSFSRLEDIYGYDIRNNDTLINYDWYKRYFSIHRLELSLSKKLKIALTESMIFGGKDQKILSQYTNPANIFFLSKMSDRKGYEDGSANELIALEFLYKPLKKISLYSQFLIDDIDFTKKLRAKYPDRLGVLSKITVADLFPETQLYFVYNRINNWTYNSFYTWGNYVFYGKSIGYPTNGVENFRVGFDCFKFSPFVFTVNTQYNRERAQDLNTHFIAIKSGFPIGISQNSYNTALEITYFPNIFISGSLNIEYIKFSNFEHIKNNNKEYLNLYLSLKLNGVFQLMK